MVKVRIIPTILFKEIGIVKGIAFNSWRRVGSLLPAIKVYNTRQVDELILMDIAATKEDRPPDYDMIDEISSECFVPLTVGGGISRLDHIRGLLFAGADKISINSGSYNNPYLISEGAFKFGTQCMVGSIDVFEDHYGVKKCFSQCGEKPTGYDPLEWAVQLEKNGAGELLITSINRDGTMKGYDVDLIRSISNEVRIPVIASGGCGSYEDMYSVFKHTHASAAAAASIFHFTQQTPMEAKYYLRDRGIPVRL